MKERPCKEKNPVCHDKIFKTTDFAGTLSCSVHSIAAATVVTQTRAMTLIFQIFLASLYHLKALGIL